MLKFWLINKTLNRRVGMMRLKLKFRGKKMWNFGFNPWKSLSIYDTHHVFTVIDCTCCIKDICVALIYEALRLLSITRWLSSFRDSEHVHCIHLFWNVCGNNFSRKWRSKTESISLTPQMASHSRWISTNQLPTPQPSPWPSSVPRSPYAEWAAILRSLWSSSASHCLDQSQARLVALSPSQQPIRAAQTVPLPQPLTWCSSWTASPLSPRNHHYPLSHHFL